MKTNGPIPLSCIACIQEHFTHHEHSHYEYFGMCSNEHRAGECVYFTLEEKELLARCLCHKKVVLNL